MVDQSPQLFTSPPYSLCDSKGRMKERVTREVRKRRGRREREKEGGFA